jgi:hypothetical protein
MKNIMEEIKQWDESSKRMSDKKPETYLGKCLFLSGLNIVMWSHSLVEIFPGSELFLFGGTIGMLFAFWGILFLVSTDEGRP